MGAPAAAPDPPSQGIVSAMNPGDVGRTLLRRWYLVVLVLALTVGGAVYAGTRVGPTYEATGSVLVFPPAAQDDPESVTNPYLALTGLVQARDIVVRTVGSKSVEDSFAERFPETTFTAAPDNTNSAPIILFVVESGTARDATRVLDELMLKVPETLEELQGDLDLRPRERITSMPLTQDADPAVLHKSQIRAGITVGAGGLALGLLLIALVDGLLTRRARRKAGAKGA